MFADSIISGVPEPVEFATLFYALVPGDLVMTGAPERVAPIHPGDVMNASVEAIAKCRFAL
jgi:2,4-diketo-3-deoxy-L-fuconate hydrolase